MTAFKYYCRYSKKTGVVRGFETFMTPKGDDFAEFSMDESAWRSCKEEHDKYSNQGFGNLFVVVREGDDFRVSLNSERISDIAAAKRAERDDRLFSRELTIHHDSTLSAAKTADINRVRQALYNITEQDGWPLSVDWPELDGAIL